MGSSDTGVGGDQPVCPAAPELGIHVTNGRVGAVVVPRGAPATTAISRYSGQLSQRSPCRTSPRPRTGKGADSRTLRQHAVKHCQACQNNLTAERAAPFEPP